MLGFVCPPFLWICPHTSCTFSSGNNFFTKYHSCSSLTKIIKWLLNIIDFISGGPTRPRACSHNCPSGCFWSSSKVWSWGFQSQCFSPWGGGWPPFLWLRTGQIRQWKWWKWRRWRCHRKEWGWRCGRDWGSRYGHCCKCAYNTYWNSRKRG